MSIFGKKGRRAKNIFTNGDTINGRIILEASKETRIQSLAFIAKGKARVQFSEHYGLLGKVNPEISEDYSYKQKYYRMKQHILKETRQNGRHVFPFSFRIPERRLPSSFSSIFGQIIHTLKATLKQSMMPAKKAKTHFTFVSKAEMNLPGITKLTVSLHCTGEALRVRVEIENLSSRSVKPKFVLYEKKSFFGSSRGKILRHDIMKEKADAVDANAGKKTVIKEIIIPPELSPSILNCSIIKLEYRLKVRVILEPMGSSPRLLRALALWPLGPIAALSSDGGGSFPCVGPFFGPLCSKGPLLGGSLQAPGVLVPLASASVLWGAGLWLLTTTMEHFCHGKTLDMQAHSHKHLHVPGFRYLHIHFYTENPYYYLQLSLYTFCIK
uniref:Arrestin C-terminal-like domain-containing protein n=1 Tax=Fundulus heteroclitus TaxID=8078 RepID=A0A3Q2P279_FUNHE